MHARSSAVFVAAAVVALAAAFSCKTFDLPNETCDPSGLHAEPITTGSSNGTCDRCLEDRCCDKVGVCANKSGCADVVSGVHQCVLRAGLQGARSETTCAEDHKLADLTEAEDTYRCMRESCGSECGLPVCKVGAAALLIHSADCDGCFASSCCPQLDACYGSRACKLTVECIVKECGGELGTALTTGAVHANPPVDASAEPTICDDAGHATFDAPSCVQRCLCAFENNDQGLPPADFEKRPIILALRVYECGVQARCGPFCTDPASDGGDAATP